MPGNWGAQMNGVSRSSDMDNSKLEGITFFNVVAF